MKNLSLMLSMKIGTIEFSEGQPRKLVLVFLCLLFNANPYQGI